MPQSKADAPFIFEGSVMATSASNVSSVPADGRTVVVQVDHVRHAPRALAGFAGKEITVRMAPGEKLAEGEHAVFFTDSLVFGEHMAVQSLGHDPVPGIEAKAALAAASPVVQKLRRRIDQASSVVSGQVTDVRPAPETTSMASPKKSAGKGRAAAAAPSSIRISEHTPFWHDAVIQVSGVHKGPSEKKVIVRFPTSTDVKWRKAPKFKKGQKGIWILHPETPTPTMGMPLKAALKKKGAAPQPVYTALDPNDFHSAAEAPTVESMLPAVAKKKSKKRAAKAPGRKRRR